MKPSSYLRFFGLTCGIGLLLSGCLFKAVTVSTRRFILTPIPTSERASSTAEQLSIGIGYIEMPTYLQKNSIAVRKGTNEIQYFDDAVWGERLGQSMQQTLAANLSALLPSDQVYLSAWERGQVKLRLFVNVVQFDVDTKGQGRLIARWRITPAESDKLLKSGQARLSHPGPTPRGNPQVIVSTLSFLTAEFSRELAQAIQQSAEVSSP